MITQSSQFQRGAAIQLLLVILVIIAIVVGVWLYLPTRHRDAANLEKNALVSDVLTSLDEARVRLGESLEKAGQSLKDASESAEAERLRTSIEEFRVDLRKKSYSTAEEAKVEMGRVAERGKKLAGELKEYGRDDLAEDIDQNLAAWKSLIHEATTDHKPAESEAPANAQ